MPVPFFQREDVGSPSDRRLLVVSYHFTPDAAVGAKRWERLSAFAVERGWGVDVIMRRTPKMHAAMPALRRLPPDVRVFGIPDVTLGVERLEKLAAAQVGKWRQASSVAGTTAPSAPGAARPQQTSIAASDLRWGLTAPRGWLRAYWSWLEYVRTRAWGTLALQLAREIYEPGIHQAVVASGPPFMVHDAGRRIGQALRIPFVMDMRDPWSHAERMSESIASPLWLRLADRHEPRAVNAAALIVANTDRARSQLMSRYPKRSDDIITVTNGSDDDALPVSAQSTRFVIAHAGTVYLDRDPRGLFQAAAQVIRELALTPQDFGLAFVGELEAIGGFPIHAVAAEEGIAQFVDTGPSRSHAEAMQFMADATMLVTMSGDNVASIPAKTFEVIRFPAWVLALSATGSATDLLLRDSGADVVQPRSVDQIAAVIKRRYLEFRANGRPQPVGRDPRFTRAFQSRILFDAIEARVVRKPVREPRYVALAQQNASKL